MKSLVSSFMFTLLLVAYSDQKEYKYGHIHKRVPGPTSLKISDFQSDLDNYLNRFVSFAIVIGLVLGIIALQIKSM